MKKKNVVYQNLAAEIRRSIMSGLLKPGDRIPGEFDLVREHGISRTTARLAIQELERSSLVYRRRGSGTFVCANSGNAPVRRSVFSDFVRERSGTIGREVLSVRWSEASGELASALDIPPNSAVLEFRRLDRLEGRPMAFDDGWISGPCAHHLGREDLAVLEFYEHWQRKQEICISRSEFELWADAASEEQSGILGVPIGFPVLIERSDVLVENGGGARFRTCYRSDLYRFKRTFFHNPSK
jgi:GntR family transcriptional regulator